MLLTVLGFMSIGFLAVIVIVAKFGTDILLRLMKSKNKEHCRAVITLPVTDNEFIPGIGHVTLLRISRHRALTSIPQEYCYQNNIAKQVKSLTGDSVVGEVVDQDGDMLVVRLYDEVLGSKKPYEHVSVCEEVSRRN